MSAKDEPPVGLICLGASAGGLRSLEAIVSELPADLAWPVLISQHMQIDRVSQMPGILARVARMPVREVVAGETPKAGTIYTCPSSHEVGVTLGGQITLRPPTAGKPQRIDHLFATASYARPGRMIAVILSGTGTDGAVGSLVVKLNGGTVISESEETAQHLGMPDAAQRAGSVDVTLAAGAIAPVLHAMAQRSLEGSSAAARSLVKEIARNITRSDGPDFAHYREGTLRRQSEKRRIIRGLGSRAEYRDHVARDPSERDALTRSILIAVTEFFRDAAAWRALEDEVIPLLAARVRAGHLVRVWCVGCATGEEAYSVGMLLAENITDRHRVHILGTDLDPGVIEAAARGAYDTTRMRGVDELRRERFFRKTEHGYQIHDDVRKMVEFRVHDATGDDAPGSFDLIVCRNLLIYFDEALQARTLQTFRAALAGPRILFLGRSETIQGSPGDFGPVLRSMRIFRAAGEGDAGGPHDGFEMPSRRASRTSSWSRSPDVIVEEPDAIVLILDDAERITSANERARMMNKGELVGTRLLDLFPRWQGSPVHDALRASAATGRSLTVRGAPSPEGPVDVTLERALGPVRGTLLIATPALARSRPVDPEVADARDDLAATNDELQSANEELAATNEELQATNEELASLNEEFQATNQTLASTNVELGEVAKSAQKATDLVNEFIQAWRDAIVACDGDQRVTEFNRRAAELFGLDRSAIGRPIQLVSLAPDPAEVVGWLETSRAGPLKKSVKHGGGDHELSVTYVKDPAGSPLGWVLSWALPP